MEPRKQQKHSPPPGPAYAKLHSQDPSEAPAKRTLFQFHEGSTAGSIGSTYKELTIPG